MKVAIGFAIVFIAASPAFAQIDTFSLRSKYGVPLDRETFAVRQRIEMVVDYGPSKQVCRIQLPSGIQIVGGSLRVRSPKSRLMKFSMRLFRHQYGAKN